MMSLKKILNVASLSLLSTCLFAMEKDENRWNLAGLCIASEQQCNRPLSYAESFHAINSDRELLKSVIDYNVKLFNDPDKLNFYGYTPLDKIKIIISDYINTAFNKYCSSLGTTNREISPFIQELIEHRTHLTDFFATNLSELPPSQRNDIEDFLQKITYSEEHRKIFIPLEKRVGSVCYKHWNQFVALKYSLLENTLIQSKKEVVKRAHGEEEAGLVYFGELVTAFLKHLESYPQDAKELLKDTGNTFQFIYTLRELGLIKNSSIYYSPSYKWIRNISFSEETSKFIFPPYLVHISEKLEIFDEELLSFQQREEKRQKEAKQIAKKDSDRLEGRKNSSQDKSKKPLQKKEDEDFNSILDRLNANNSQLADFLSNLSDSDSD